MPVLPQGFRHLPGLLDRDAQHALVEEVRAVVCASPLYVPAMPGTGKPMSVRMTNCGPLGWVTDKERGYRYQETHPVTGAPWPPIPDRLLDLWRVVADHRGPPQACLINFYPAGARMGLHQDRDEEDFAWPVLSVSLGDSAVFRLGGAARRDPTRTVRLASGDVCLLAGAARLHFHGVDRILAGSSRLVPGGGRINLTLRRARA